MKYGIKNMTHSEQESIKPDTGIDWNHYNYPPCLKIFHYSREHVPEDLKRLVFLLWFNHILILVTTVFNFVTNIVATATGYTANYADILMHGSSWSSASSYCCFGPPWDSISSTFHT